VLLFQIKEILNYKGFPGTAFLFSAQVKTITKEHETSSVAKIKLEK
jgi:hypothetical protein